ncbi:hypothetical protein O181_030168 [Austropuccinia psidii MF-1]|uniref:Uncharacterized protein n=1 Tax=Austropuccinia psidii MF-1 TaxID=1389203 RepID=A0A9Q3CX77_9BASI|nr:hypothetical protein [Austropuccinia psidii MF-1]
MFNNKLFFETLYLDNQTKVSTGCGKYTLMSHGKGLAKIFYRLGNLWLLPNRVYVPNLTTNLLALSSIAKNKTQIKKTTLQLEIYLDNKEKTSFICPITSNILETQVELSDSCCLNTRKREDGNLWYKQLGDMNKKNIKKLVNTTEISSLGNECIKDPNQTTEYTSNGSNTGEDSSSIKSNSVNNEEDIYVDALEQQPKRIRVIGPRQPTLI